MTYFIKSGNTFNVTNNANINICDVLPAGNYTVKFNEFKKEFYLEQVDSFLPAKKVYGNATQRANRIIRTFLDRTASTGVLLTGEKGSGKTLLARELSIQLAKEGVPTIIINDPYCGDEFNAFIQLISQPAVVLFDEFEKVYDRDDQEKILTLLDGVYPTKKLFVLTCNDKFRIDSHMRNRPGRIYYSLEFAGLEREFIEEYCQDNLINKAHIDGVLTISSLFAAFNFDMLKALVEEMNRFNEAAVDAIQMLNAKPMSEDSGRYTIKVVDKDGNVISMSDTNKEGNPLKQDINYLWTNLSEEPDYRIEFRRDEVVSVTKEGEIVFKNSDGYVVTYKLEVPPMFDFRAF